MGECLNAIQEIRGLNREGTLGNSGADTEGIFSAMRMPCFFTIFMVDCVLLNIVKVIIYHYILEISILRGREDKHIYESNIRIYIM